MGEVSALLEQANGDSPKEIRDKAMLELCMQQASV